MLSDFRRFSDIPESSAARHHQGPCGPQLVCGRIKRQQIGEPPEQYLTAKLARESDMTPARFEAAVRRVRDDIAATRGVKTVTVADKLPGPGPTRVEGGPIAALNAE
jgi:hypothetical protein